MPTTPQIILFAIYFLAILLIIYKAKLFKNTKIKPAFLIIFFVIKLLVGLSLNYYYQNRYEDGEKADIYKYFNDSEVLHNLAIKNPRVFVNIFLGRNEESPHIKKYISDFENWEVMSERYKEVVNYKSSNFLNTQRTMIRINTIIHFISFGYLPIHTLFFSFISFIGLCLLFIAIKPYIVGRELSASIIIFLLPSVLIWTSGILKESVIIFCLGIIIYTSFKPQINIRDIITALIAGILLIVTSLHISVILLFSYMFYFIVKRRSLLRLSLFLLLCIIAIFSMIKLDINPIERIASKMNHQRQIGMGGYYFMCLDNYDWLYVSEQEIKDKFSNSFDNQYVFYDSVYLKSNLIVSRYTWGEIHDEKFMLGEKEGGYRYMLGYKKANSFIPIQKMEPNFKGLFNFVPIALKNVFLEPLPSKKYSGFSIAFMIENLLVLITIFYTVIGLILRKIYLPSSSRSEFTLFIVFALSLYLLIGFTSPIIGNIVRYKAPAICLLLLAICFLKSNNTSKFKQIKIIKQTIFNR